MLRTIWKLLILMLKDIIDQVDNESLDSKLNRKMKYYR